MAAAIPASGIALHGVAEGEDDLNPRMGSVILFKLSDSILEDIRTTKEGLRLVTGNVPVT